MSKTKHQPVTPAEEQAMRDEIDAWVHPEGASMSDGRLHISCDGKPLCTEREGQGGRAKGYVEKDVAVFPPGYREVCQYCGSLFRAGKL